MSSARIAFGRRLGLLVWPVVLLVVPAVLLAHTRLVRSDPASGAQLSTAPTAIALWFSERPELAFTRIHLKGANGVEVPLGAAKASGDAEVTFAITRPLEPGAYVVVWQAAAADGHLSKGTFSFTITAPAAAPAPTPTAVAPASPATPPKDSSAAAGVGEPTAVRWMEFVALLALGGTVFFALLLVPALERRGAGLTRSATEAARRLAQACSVLAAITLLWRLYGECAMMFGGRHGMGPSDFRTVLFTTSWGFGWLIGAVGLLVMVVGLFVARANSRAGWNTAAIGALALLVYPAFTGHALADHAHPVLATVADGLHVIGASMWLGTLLVVVLVGIPWVLGRAEGERGSGIVMMIGAFNGLALTGAGLVVLTGVTSAFLHLNHVSDLWTTDYGSALFRKLIAFAFVVVLGAYNWRRVTPTLGTEESPRRIRRSAAMELVIAAVVLALTAILVGRDLPHNDSKTALEPRIPSWQHPS